MFAQHSVVGPITQSLTHSISGWYVVAFIFQEAALCRAGSQQWYEVVAVLSRVVYIDDHPPDILLMEKSRT